MHAISRGTAGNGNIDLYIGLLINQQRRRIHGASRCVEGYPLKPTFSSPRPRRRVPRQQRPRIKHTGLVSRGFRHLWKENETYSRWIACRTIKYARVPGLPDEIANNPTRWFDLVEESHPLPVTVRFSPNRVPRLFDKATREINHVLSRHQKTRQRRRRQDRGFVWYSTSATSALAAR